jgi:hypothetical protein
MFALLQMRLGRILPLAAIVLTAGCGNAGLDDEGAPQRPRLSGSPNARRGVVEMLRQDHQAERHPADGGGTAWIASSVPESGPVTAGTSGRWSFVYRAGPLGVAEGGTIFLQVPPFWGWSAPQLSFPDFPGFVTVSTDAEGVRLAPSVPDQNLLAVRITGRQLREGEQVRIVYGAGTAGATADRFAERQSRFWFAVDGDGDGVRAILRESPAVDVGPGRPARMILTLPTTSRPGRTVRLTVAILDGIGNAGCRVSGDVLLDALPQGLDVPERVVLTTDDEGLKAVDVIVRDEGVYRLRGRAPGGLVAESNPMVVGRTAARVLWADLQIHSNFSDGSGTPEENYRYARDAAALDVAALTDHDHWGMPFLDHDPAMWDEIRRQTRRFNEPGRFLTLLGYEWTSWIYGHRHVLFPGDDGAVYSSIDPRYESPRQLWEALRPWSAMTVAHHTAGEPIATDWSIPPDPKLETVAELVSVHGSSEASDSPATVRGAIAGHFVRNALDRGYRLGFVGSGDGHDGHPGLNWIAAATGGLAGVLSEQLTREGVFEALRSRRVYATSGPRIFLNVTLGGHGMGSAVPSTGGTSTLEVRAVTPGPVERIDLIRTGEVVDTVAGAGRRDASFSRELTDLRPGEYVYVRLVQQDLGMAWSSPFFVE